jgi:Ca2+-binding EF-hand superfamily protein
VRRYAEALLKQYDKNKNGILEKDEWMQMRSNWRDSDTNGDGIVTLDELAAKMGSFSRPSRSGPTNESSNSSGSSVASASSGGNSNPTSKRSYRFLSPHERLPRGLPDAFLRKDADGDGQVTMAEFSRSGWTDALAEDFARQDLNGDGIITPEECLKAMSGK